MFLAALAINMHKTKYRGARDLSIDKVSAPYDAWRSKNVEKLKMSKNLQKTDVFCLFCLIFEEQRKNGCQRWIPSSFWLQIHI